MHASSHPRHHTHRSLLEVDHVFERRFRRSHHGVANKLGGKHAEAGDCDARKVASKRRKAPPIACNTSIGVRGKAIDIVILVSSHAIAIAKPSADNQGPSCREKA